MLLLLLNEFFALDAEVGVAWWDIGNRGLRKLHGRESYDLVAYINNHYQAMVRGRCSGASNWQVDLGFSYWRS